MKTSISCFAGPALPPAPLYVLPSPGAISLIFTTFVDGFVFGFVGAQFRTSPEIPVFARRRLQFAKSRVSNFARELCFTAFL